MQALMGQRSSARWPGQPLSGMTIPTMGRCFCGIVSSAIAYWVLPSHPAMMADNSFRLS